MKNKVAFYLITALSLFGIILTSCSSFDDDLQEVSETQNIITSAENTVSSSETFSETNMPETINTVISTNSTDFSGDSAKNDIQISISDTEAQMNDYNEPEIIIDDSNFKGIMVHFEQVDSFWQRIILISIDGSVWEYETDNINYGFSAGNDAWEESLKYILNNSEYSEHLSEKDTELISKFVNDLNPYNQYEVKEVEGDYVDYGEKSIIYVNFNEKGNSCCLDLGGYGDWNYYLDDKIVKDFLNSMSETKYFYTFGYVFE